MSPLLIQLVIQSTSIYTSNQISPLDLRHKYLAHAQQTFQLYMSKPNSYYPLQSATSRVFSTSVKQRPFFHLLRSTCVKASLTLSLRLLRLLIQCRAAYSACSAFKMHTPLIAFTVTAPFKLPFSLTWKPLTDWSLALLSSVYSQRSSQTDHLENRSLTPPLFYSMNPAFLHIS